jgi:hypothetical protein
VRIVITRASMVLAISVLWLVLAAFSSPEPSLTVPARANIFGSGQAEPPDPGGGGAGVLPPTVPLPPGAKRVVTFPSVTGRVNPIMDYDDWNGPAGDGVGGTNVESFGGISGIVHAANGMFLVGVFLSDGLPPTPEPSRLDFTNGMPADPLTPELGQTFLIGDGKGHKYNVPLEATRLYLGFADGYLYQGPPGWYDNNAGALKVTVDITVG